MTPPTWSSRGVCWVEEAAEKEKEREGGEVEKEGEEEREGEREGEGERGGWRERETEVTGNEALLCSSFTN